MASKTPGRRAMIGEHPASSGSRRASGWTCTVVLFGALLTAGCDIEVLGGGGEVVDRFSLTVTVTNVGNGFGRAEVTFPAGTPRDPCTDVLGPGESCSPSVTAPLMVQTAEIEVTAEPGSEFIGWAGIGCSGTSTECTVEDRSGDRDAKVDVEPRFDLVESEGGDPVSSG